MNSAEVQERQESNREIVISLLLLVAFVLLGLFVGQFIGALFVFVLFDFELSKVMQVLSGATVEVPQARTALLVLQAGGALLGYVVTPLVHQQLIDRTPFTSILSTQNTTKLSLALTGLLVVACLPAIVFLAEWNRNIDFSIFSPAFHNWATAQEENLGELLTFITQFESVSGLLGGLLVIAVLPGLGEEILFRGVLQRRLQSLVGNPHAAIWIAATIFSAIHIQFFGFFPRMLLGALFGYVYYWSGSLWYAIIAHFMYNGTTIVLLYLHQHGVIDTDIDATQSVPWSTAALSVAIGAVLLFIFKRQTSSRYA